MRFIVEVYSIEKEQVAKLPCFNLDIFACSLFHVDMQSGSIYGLVVFPSKHTHMFNPCRILLYSVRFTQLAQMTWFNSIVQNNSTCGIKRFQIKTMLCVKAWKYCQQNARRTKLALETFSNNENRNTEIQNWPLSWSEFFEQPHFYVACKIFNGAYNFIVVPRRPCTQLLDKVFYPCIKGRG